MRRGHGCRRRGGACPGLPDNRGVDQGLDRTNVSHPKRIGGPAIRCRVGVLFAHRIASMPEPAPDPLTHRCSGRARRSTCGLPLSDGRLLFGVLFLVAACSPQLTGSPRASAHVEPPDPPPITDREIVGTWVGTTVCRGIGSERTVELVLTIKLDYVSVDSCKTHVCEHTIVTGVLQRIAPGDAGTTVQETVRASGMLAGRGVELYRIDRTSGRSVHVLGGDVSMDGATFSGRADDCGGFSLRKRG